MKPVPDRRRIDVAELSGVLEELTRRANGASRIHELNHSARTNASVTYYHLGRSDGLRDATALLQALIDWADAVQSAAHPKRQRRP